MASECGRIKVCIVSAILPPAYGGAEVAALRYANRLNQNPDSEAIVIGWDRTGEYKKSRPQYDFIYPVRVTESPKDADGIWVYFQQYYHIWKCFWSLLKPMWKLRDKYDYIHNFNSGFAFNRTSILIGKILRKKVVTETSLIGDDDPLSLARFLNWKDYFKPKFLRYLFYMMADRYISKSEVITELFKRSNVPMYKVAQIPYSVDILKFKPLQKQNVTNLRKKLRLWHDGFIILFVGGINIRKGVHILIDAVIMLVKKYPQMKLLVAGPTYKYDQTYISDLKEKIKKFKLEDKIIFTEENVSNVEEFMQSADIFVLPSRQEGFPISMVEAMSCGLGVIGSDIPEISEIQINNGTNGLLFPLGHVEELAISIEKLFLDKNMLIKMGKEARKKVITNWSDQLIDISYKNLYEEIVH